MQLYADPTELTAQVSALLAVEAAPSSSALLQLALLCLQTGHPDQATRLRRSGQLSAEHQAELQSLESCDLSLPRFQGQCLESCFYTDPMKTNDHNECPFYATPLQR